MSAHPHPHPHGDHDHAGNASERRLALAAALTGGFMLAEIAGGLVSGSLALLADAGHMFVDFAGLAVAFFAIRLARRPADARRTFGYGRFQILVAYSNGLVLFGVAALIVVEAWKRFSDPVEVLAGPMLVVAVGGLLVNVAGFAILHGGDKHDLNLRGALLHVAGDLLGSIAAIAASLVILWTGWMPIDPILSALVAVLILGNAWKLVAEAGHILLEGVPASVEVGAIGAHLRSTVPGLTDIHHLHVWSLTGRQSAATLHARIPDDGDGTATVRAIKRALAERFAIAHVTVELERGACADADAHDHGRHDHPHDHPHDGNHADYGCAPEALAESSVAPRPHGHAAHHHRHLVAGALA